MIGAVKATEVASKRANWVKRNIIVTEVIYLMKGFKTIKRFVSEQSTKKEESSSFETEKKIRGDGTSSRSIKVPGFSIVSQEPYTAMVRVSS